MAITTVGSLKTDTSTSQLSITLDASPAVLPGDVIVWACGGAGDANTYFAPSGWRRIVIGANAASTQNAAVAATVAVGGEEGDTIVGPTASAVAMFCAVQVYRASAGRRLDVYGIPTGYTDKAGGTATSYTLTSSATTAPGSLAICVARGSSGMNAAAPSDPKISWDGETAANAWDYSTGSAKVDTKIYTAKDTPDVVVSSLGTANKAVVLAVLQEIQTGTVLPWL